VLAISRLGVLLEVVIQIIEGNFVLKMVAYFTFANLVVEHSSLVLVRHSRLYILRHFGHRFLDVRQISFGAEVSLSSLL